MGRVAWPVSNRSLVRTSQGRELKNCWSPLGSDHQPIRPNPSSPTTQHPQHMQSEVKCFLPKDPTASPSEQGSIWKRRIRLPLRDLWWVISVIFGIEPSMWWYLVGYLVKHSTALAKGCLFSCLQQETFTERCLWLSKNLWASGLEESDIHEKGPMFLVISRGRKPGPNEARGTRGLLKHLKPHPVCFPIQVLGHLPQPATTCHLSHPLKCKGQAF